MLKARLGRLKGDLGRLNVAYIVLYTGSYNLFEYLIFV